MVNRGHQHVFANSSRLKRITGMGVVPLCVSRRDTSTDMQHYLRRSTCDLDLRSYIDPDLSRSLCICFYAPCQEEHDGVRVMPLAFLARKLFAKNVFAKKAVFAVFDPCFLNR